MKLKNVLISVVGVITFVTALMVAPVDKAPGSSPDVFGAVQPGAFVAGAGISGYLLGSQVSVTKLTPNASYTIAYSMVVPDAVGYRVIVQSSVIAEGTCSSGPCSLDGTTVARATTAGKVVVSLTSGGVKVPFVSVSATKV